MAAPPFEYFLGTSGFSIYERFAALLDAQGNWKRQTGKLRLLSADVLLADRFDIPYALLRDRRTPRKLLVNYFRGSHKLTLKAAMAKVLRTVNGSSSWAPSTYILSRKPGVEDERALLQAEHAALTKGASAPRGEATVPAAATVTATASDAVPASRTTESSPPVCFPPCWIVKPSAGCKGKGILVSRDVAEIGAFVDASATGVFVAQRYIDRPMLIRGRKFDIRVWALLSHPYRMFMFDEGSCRTASEPFRLDDLSNQLVHLTNHCLQEASPSFGQFEPGNEMWFDEFEAYLTSVRAPFSLLDLKSQFATIISASLNGVRDLLQVDPSEPFECFQLFGFDFLVTEEGRVVLLEINGSPGSADRWMDALVGGIINLEIVPRFQLPAALPIASARGKWEEIHPPGSRRASRVSLLPQAQAASAAAAGPRPAPQQQAVGEPRPLDDPPIVDAGASVTDKAAKDSVTMVALAPTTNIVGAEAART